MQHENISKGDKVKIRDASGRITERIVWDVMESCVLVCSQRQFKWLQSGDFRAAPIGFKWSDVVEY